jgi:spermidine synthase
MPQDFEELDFQQTALGDISLRRRREPRAAGIDVFEVKLGDEYLMSSLFTVGEQALATLGLAAVTNSTCDVVVGGLGLGYTACAALAFAQVREMLVVEALAPVIAWHRRALVPLGAQLNADQRCRLLCGDFFALAASAEGFDHTNPGRQFDAILLDIDHSPQHRLDDNHDEFYGPVGLAALAAHLRPAGVFAMWSNDPPDDAFSALLRSAFATVRAQVVSFANPYTAAPAACTIYVAHV